MFLAVVGTGLFFHPLTHRPRRVHELERERACDDAARLATGQEPLALADALTRLEPGRLVPSLPMMTAFSSGHLTARVRRLLGRPAPRQSWWTAVPFVGMTLLALRLMTGIAHEAGALGTDRPVAVVVVDAGRGGGTGARGFVPEDEVVLAVTLKLAKYLESRGVKVRLTRSGDSAPPGSASESLAGRARPGEGADLFVSLHAAAGAASHLRGITTRVRRPVASESPSERELARRAAAGAIRTRLIAATGARDRGVKANVFYLLRRTPAPAVLVELGLVTNEAEAERLATEEYQAVLAAALADGVLEFLGR